MSQFLSSTRTASFEDLKSACGDKIRTELAAEQRNLCAFCCNSLSEYEFQSRIAHVVPQKIDPGLATSYANLVLSCDSENLTDPSCDAAQKHRSLPVGPLTSNVDALFRYGLSGKMEGLNQAAQETIRILNLDGAADDREHRLRRARRLAIAAAIQQKAKVTPDRWNRMLTGNFKPMLPFKPAIAFVLR